MRAVSEASTRTIIGSPEGGQPISSAKQRNRPGDHNWHSQHYVKYARVRVNFSMVSASAAFWVSL
jgi:hypothetical protein